MPFAVTWVTLENIILSKRRQKEKDEYHMIKPVESKKNTNESMYKIETDSQTQKTNLWLPKRKGRRGG